MFPFVPMLIGAALGGGLSAARGGNFLTGALLGGIGGGVGAGLLGSAGGAATGGGFAGGGYGSVGVAGQTALPSAGLFSNTLGGLSKDFGAVTDWAKANPMDALKGAQMGKNILFPEQQQMPQIQPMGILRGQQTQQQAPAYALSRPQISLI